MVAQSTFQILLQDTLHCSNAISEFQYIHTNGFFKSMWRLGTVGIFSDPEIDPALLCISF